MNAREIAGKLTELQREVVTGCDCGEDRVWKRAINFSGNCALRLARRGLHVSSLLRTYRDSSGRRWFRLTPLGLEVRQILQEQSK